MFEKLLLSYLRNLPTDTPDDVDGVTAEEQHTKACHQLADFLSSSMSLTSSESPQVKTRVTYYPYASHKNGIFVHPTLNSDTAPHTRTFPVDVILTNQSSNTAIWLKYIQRSATNLHSHWLGYSNTRGRCLVSQLQEWNTARQGKCSYLPQGMEHHDHREEWPEKEIQIWVLCTRGVTRSLKGHLERHLGVHVVADEVLDSASMDYPVLPDDEDLVGDSPEVDLCLIEDCGTAVNLDASVLVALVSEVCQGDAALTMQLQSVHLQPVVEDERRHPCLEELQSFLRDKTWLICDTAWNSFQNILDTVAGSNERRRGLEMLSRCQRVPDPDLASEDSHLLIGSLRTSKSIQEKNKIVFATGEKYNAVTVTSNYAFLRAAQMQGITLRTFVHRSRALTEIAPRVSEQ